MKSGQKKTKGMPDHLFLKISDTKKKKTLKKASFWEPQVLWIAKFYSPWNLELLNGQGPWGMGSPGSLCHP